MLLPEPAAGVVIPPVLVPNVQANVLDALAVNDIPVPVPLQIDSELAVVTTGVGLTVTVMV